MDPIPRVEPTVWSLLNADWTEPWYRAMTLRVDDQLLAAQPAEDTRIPIAISSEQPVLRWDWRRDELVHEILDHSPESVDLTRVEGGAPFLADHNSKHQIGLIEDLELGDDRVLRGRVRFGAHPDAEWIRRDMLSGIRTRISVGYLPDRESAVRTQAAGDDIATLRIMRWTVLEASSVAIPADITVGVGRGLDRGATPTNPPPTPPDYDPAPAEERTMQQNDTPAPEARHTPQEAAAIVRLATQHGLTDRAATWLEEGTSLDEVRGAILDELARRSAPATPPAPAERGEDTLEAPAVHTTRTPDEPGMLFGRTLFYLGAGKGDPDKAESIARKAGDRIGIRALAAGQETQGGFLVQEEVASDVIELLRPASVVRSLDPVIVPMTSGSLTIGKLAGGANASYIGENQPAGATQPDFGAVKFQAKKLAALVPISNDLLRRATPATDRLIRDDAVAAMAQRSDAAFIRGAGSQFAPTGLRYQAPSDHVLSVTAGHDLAKVTGDLHRMILTLEEADVRMLRPGWLMAPRTKRYLMNLRDANGNFAFQAEMLRGELLGYPFRSTTQIPTNLNTDESELYLADFADVVIGESLQLLVSMSDSAAYVDAQGSVQSAFSRDQTVLRVLQEHDLQMRHDESVVVIDDIDWVIA